MNILFRSCCLLVLSVITIPVWANGPWHAARQNTYGWQYMSPDERIEHQRRMRSFRNYEECRAYQEEHHEQMEQRAHKPGDTLQRHADSGCEQLRQQGRLQ